jgi:hypothetical protein
MEEKVEVMCAGPCASHQVSAVFVGKAIPANFSYIRIHLSLHTIYHASPFVTGRQRQRRSRRPRWW